MKIYTRTGDQGETGLFGGIRLGKDDVRVECYGAVDEVVAQLGVARACAADEVLGKILERVQRELFVVGAELACVPGKEPKLGLELVADEAIHALERTIDELESDLPPLLHFILPGGAALAAALHVARTVCRRAERRVIGLSRVSSVRPELVRYLNRLSDLFFVMARAANHRAGIADLPWSGKEARE